MLQVLILDPFVLKTISYFDFPGSHSPPPHNSPQVFNRRKLPLQKALATGETLGLKKKTRQETGNIANHLAICFNFFLSWWIVFQWKQWIIILLQLWGNRKKKIKEGSKGKNGWALGAKKRDHVLVLLEIQSKLVLEQGKLTLQTITHWSYCFFFFNGQEDEGDMLKCTGKASQGKHGHYTHKIPARSTTCSFKSTITLL